MKKSNQIERAGRPAGNLYRAFINLDPDHRRKVALRILRSEKLLEDFYDHLLIQRAMREGGRSISWASYRRTSKTAAS